MSEVSVLNREFVERLYALYIEDPQSVPEAWQRIFADTKDNRGSATVAQAAAAPVGAALPATAPAGLASIASVATGPSSIAGVTTGAASGARADAGTGTGTTAQDPAAAAEAAIAARQDRVDQLVRSFRVQGHLAAKINPLGFERPTPPELDPAFYGFQSSDMELLVSSDTIPGADVTTLGELIERLSTTYCRSIGVEYMHIHDMEARTWLQERMESSGNRLKLKRLEQLRILTRLTDAVMFEEFIREKYVGAKSFSLEGAETLIPLLDLAIEHAGGQGVDEIVLAMAHRGRLNVLANIMDKHPQDIFREFEDMDPETMIGRGDVKYHMGHSTDWVTENGHSVHLSLAFNPSHLEFVNAVALGRLRAKQDRFGEDTRGSRSLPILIHGDAAFIGEGIVQETLNLSGLPGYAIGGALHIIVNNQIGFVTLPDDARSTTYATDVAKMLQSPIFHVNGEDPEAVAQVVRVALDFRRKFKRDVVIDMYAYRRLGHNEGDDPTFTQPQMYNLIRGHRKVREGYLDHLLKLERVTAEEAERIATERRERLEQALTTARQDDFKPEIQAFQGLWKGYTGGPEQKNGDVETGVPEERLADLLRKQLVVPEGFNLHRTLQRQFRNKEQMAAGERPLDWATAEALAFATLATEGVRIRMTGQDAQRGTFSHRHAVLHDTETGEQYMPLQHLSEDQAFVEIHNSPLSEAGVLGFEYGYSLDYPDGLVIWEAQFGDFVNTAQVILDQFIASAEEKWNRLSGIVLLLPHGFEGQGPEHSSARLERFLALAATDNIQVANATTPAQYFHLLRRQVLRPWRKPLVIMTPKSLLRLPAATSPLAELTTGSFERVLADVGGPKPADTKRIMICSGKIYYELVDARTERGATDTAILRLEQLYPFPTETLEALLNTYPAGVAVQWVQEEPENMGAWPYLRRNFGEHLFKRPLSVVSRPESSSPGTGSFNAHKIEQARLLEQAFA